MADETQWLDATGQAALVRRGEVTAVELVEAAVSRIESLDGAIGAVPIRWFDAAVEQAGAQASDDLLFRGVPTLLKDLHLHERGRVLTNGNLALRNEQPISTFDAELVVRMRRSGLVTLGRSTSSELGTLPVTETAAYGPTRNPWRLERTPGGSSGGAAAAVAAGMVPVAHASDGGGIGWATFEPEGPPCPSGERIGVHREVRTATRAGVAAGEAAVYEAARLREERVRLVAAPVRWADVLARLVAAPAARLVVLAAVWGVDRSDFFAAGRPLSAFGDFGARLRERVPALVILAFADFDPASLDGFLCRLRGWGSPNDVRDEHAGWTKWISGHRGT